MTTSKEVRVTPGVRRMPNGRWKAYWRDPNGVQRSVTYDRKEDAVNARAQRLVDRKQGTYVDPNIGRTKLSAFWTERYEPWLQSKRPATIAQYGRLYRLYISPSSVIRQRRLDKGTPDIPGLGNLSLAAITPGHVIDWLIDVQRVTGKPSALAAFRVLRALFGRAVSYRYIGLNPAADVPTENRPRAESEDDDAQQAFTAEELGQIIDAMPERYKGLVMFLGLSGPRISEAAGLRVRDLDLLHRKIHIERAVVEVEGKLTEGPTKTKKTRTIDISPAVATALEAHMGEPDALVFTGPEGGPLRRSMFSARVWTPILRRLGLEHRGVHALRHTYASLAVDSGVPFTAIQKQLGHAKLEITLNTYSHLLKGSGEDAAEKVGEAFQRAQGAQGSAQTGQER